MAEPFYAKYSRNDGSWMSVPQDEATHYFDGATYLPLNRVGGDPMRPATAQTTQEVTQIPRPAAQGLMAPTTPGTPEEYVAAIRQMLVQSLVPTRQAALLGALGGLQQQANASPMAMLQAMASQIQPAVQQTQQQQRAVSTNLGPSGGRQIQRGEQQLAGGLQQYLAQLFGQFPQEGRKGLYGVAQGTSQFLPSRPTATSTGTSTQQMPFDPNTFARSAYGLTLLGSQLAPLFMQPQIPFAPAVNPTTPAFGVDPTGLGYGKA